MSGFIKPSGAATNYADSALQKPAVIAQQVLKNPTISCSITMPVQRMGSDGYMEAVTTTFPFYMSNDFSYGIESNYKPLIDPDGFLQTLNGIISGAQAVTNETQVAVQSKPMTAKMWKGSKFSGFDIKCVFVCTDRRFNPVDVITALSATVLPTIMSDNDLSLGSASNVLTAMKAGVAMVSDVAHDIGNIVVDGVKGAIKKFNSSEAGATVQDASKKVSESTTNAIKEQMYKNPNTKQIYDDITKNGGTALDALGKAASNFRGTNKETMNKIIMDAGMVAPLHYGIEFQESNGHMSAVPKENTCVTLRVGDWFEAPDLVVTSMGNVTYSKELIAPPSSGTTLPNDIYKPTNDSTEWGFPLYATCSFHLEPVTMMDYETYCSYFKLDSRKIYDKFSSPSTGSSLLSYAVDLVEGVWS